MLLRQFVLLFAFCTGIAYCSRSVTFKVLSFGTSKTQVVVNGKKYNLKATTAGEPLYKGKLSTAPDGEFK